MAWYYIRDVLDEISVILEFLSSCKTNFLSIILPFKNRYYIECLQLDVTSRRIKCA